MVSNETLFGNNYKKVVPHAFIFSVPLVIISIAVLMGGSAYGLMQSEEMLKSKGIYDNVVDSSNISEVEEYMENLSFVEKLEMATGMMTILFFWSVVAGFVVDIILAVFIFIGIRRISKRVPMTKYWDRFGYAGYMYVFTFFAITVIMYLMTGGFRPFGFDVFSLSVLFAIPRLVKTENKVNYVNPSS
jgi:hypothetical protein